MSARKRNGKILTPRLGHMFHARTIIASSKLPWEENRAQLGSKRHALQLANQDLTRLAGPEHKADPKKLYIQISGLGRPKEQT